MTLFEEYKAHGWQLCDIPPGTKGPIATGWSERGAHSHGQQGLGLCHAYSGTCSIDVDDYVVALKWLATQGVDLDSLLTDPQAVQIVSGKVNRAKLLYRLDTPLASLQVAPFEKVSSKTGKLQTFHALELRCATRNGKTVQDVLPPTIHPETGKPYVWSYGDEAFGHWSNLPPLPSALLALWKAQQVLLPGEHKVAPQATKGLSFAEIVKLLEQKDANECAYDDWLDVGMALHHETGGSSSGYQLWCDWSAKCEKHDTTHMPAKWRSFDAKTGNPVTLGFLLREQVAAPTDFDVVETAPADTGQDMRPEAIMKRELEDKLVFVRATEMYYDMSTTGHPWLTDRGIQHIFSCRMPFVERKKKAPDGSTSSKVERINPVTWLKESSTKTTVDMAGMHPGASRLYNEDGMRFVNNFVPIIVNEVPPTVAEKEAFAFLWSRMRDPVFKSWLLKFYAFALQHPGVKIQSAPLLVSAAQGTGKNTLMKVLPEILFGSRYVRSMSGNVLGGQFNDAVGSAWWLYLEELRAGANKADRMHTTNKIKSWITDNTIEVHRKGLAPYDIRNRLQPTATSNFDDALQLDNNDRRWAIGEMLGPLTSAESIDLYGFLLSDRAPGVLRHIFRAIDVRDFKPAARAPETMAKKEMVVAGIGGWEAKIIEAMVAGEAPFDRDIFRLKDVSDLMMGQGITPHALGRMLRRDPFKCELLVGRLHRFWTWRNQAAWTACSEGQRLQHMESGARPAGCLSGIPSAILAMSADAGVDSNSDLLG